MPPIRHISSKQSFIAWVKVILSRHETLGVLIWKDLKVQYGNWFLGILWAVFQPLVYLGAIGLMLHLGGRKHASGEMDPIVFLFSGIIVWNFITNAVNSTIAGIQGNANIISKAFFPRFFLVLAPVSRVVLDFLISFILLVSIAVIRDSGLSISALWKMPAALLLLLITAIGLSSLAAVAVVMNRHLRHVIPMLMYTGLFIFPVFHVLENIGNPILYSSYTLNPLAAGMTVIRSLFGTMDSLPVSLAIPYFSAFALLFIGIWAFRRMERTMADRI